MSNSKQHEQRRLHEITEARTLRKFALSLHDAGSVGLNIAHVERIEQLHKLPHGMPHNVQESGVNGFPFLPGMDGPVTE